MKVQEYNFFVFFFLLSIFYFRCMKKLILYIDNCIVESISKTTDMFSMVKDIQKLERLDDIIRVNLRKVIIEKIKTKSKVYASYIY